MAKINDLAGRPYQEGPDDERIESLLLCYRAATGLTTYPTPWRLRLLMNSRVWDPAQDMRLWPDQDGELCGFAVVWRRQPAAPALVLERLVDPAWMTEALVEAMLAWGIRRARALAALEKNPLTLYAGRLLGVDYDERVLARAGFSALEPDLDEYSLYMARPLREPLPTPALPEGYTVRRLGSLDEVEMYHRLYDFAGVSLRHRQEMCLSDECELLVVVDPEGVFIAYGEISTCRREWADSGRRLGWIDHIGTRPQNRQQGFGRAVLLASLYDLQALGAETAMLLTTSTNHAALRLYESTGFERLALPQPPGYARPVPVEE